MCRIRLDLFLNDLPQFLAKQLWPRFVRCLTRWSFSWLSKGNLSPQFSHVNLRSVWWYLCLCSPLGVSNASPQTAQVNGSWLSLWCIFLSFLLWQTNLHTWHLKVRARTLLGRLTVLMFSFPFMGVLSIVVSVSCGTGATLSFFSCFGLSCSVQFFLWLWAAILMALGFLLLLSLGRGGAFGRYSSESLLVGSSMTDIVE